MSEAASAPVDEFGDPRVAPILDAVITAFGEGGYDSVNLRTIARQAHVSLATIYSLFASREALCVAAMERWMQEQFYGSLPEPDPEQSLADRVIDVMRHLMRPYFEQPTMMSVFARVRLGPGGEALAMQGLTTDSLLRSIDVRREHVVGKDEQVLIYHIFYSLIAHHAAGKLPLTELMSTMENGVRLVLGERDGASRRAS